MSIDKVTNIKIFPGIGIGRVGNSLEYFIGPEAPGIIPDPGGGTYKDADGKIKRQAARYRVYGYDDDDNVVMEITGSSNIHIEWEVHMANKKAANYAFQGKFGFDPKALRNPGVQANLAIDQRSQLIIDPGPKNILGDGTVRNHTNGKAVPLDGGTIFEGIGEAEVPASLVNPGTPGNTTVTYHSKAVSLGRLETDSSGRLIVVPGEGKGESLTDPPLHIVKGAAQINGEPGANPNPTSNGNSYFNNPGWYDDTGGGSINAVVKVNGGATFTTNNDPNRRGWIGVAPPKYGPSLYNVVSLLDLQLNIFPESDPNSGDLYYAVTGTDNRNYLASSANGSSGYSFRDVSGLTVAGARPAILSFKGSLYYAVIGSDGNKNFIGKYSDDHSSVTDYKVIGTIASNVGPSLTVYNGQLYYAVTGKDNNVYIASSSDGETFSAFAKIGNQATSQSPSITAYNGDLYLAVTGTENRLYLGVASNNYQMEHIGGSGISKLAPSITAFDGQLYYALTGTDNNAYIASWNNNGPDKSFNFSFKFITGSPNTKLPPAIEAFNGKLYYAVTGSDQKTYLASVKAGNSDFTFKYVGKTSLSEAGPSLACREVISFYRDIYPTLKTVIDYAWVNKPAFTGHGPGTNGDFLREPYLSFLANPGPDPGQALVSRTFVYKFIRPAETITGAPPPPHALPIDPDTGKTIQYDGGVQRGSLMPHLFGEGGSPAENIFNKTNYPNQWLSLTRHQLAKFQKWVNGDFETGTKTVPVPLDSIPLADQPAAIDFAALQPTVGGGFHPGIELTYNMKFPEYFAGPFRFTSQIFYNGSPLAQITPGSVAAYMSIPWHGDFWSCNISWWAAQRPDIVVQSKPPASSDDPPILLPIDWFRSSALYIPEDASNVDAYLTLPNDFGPPGSQGTTGYDIMAQYWCKFGFVIPADETVDGEGGFKEVERDKKELDAAPGTPVPKCDTETTS